MTCLSARDMFYEYLKGVSFIFRLSSSYSKGQKNETRSLISVLLDMSI
jgi:hypothetical protein